MKIRFSRKFSIFDAPTGDHPFNAMCLVLSGVIVLALQDALIKYISPQTSFWQLQTIRACGNLSLIICLSIAAGGVKLVVPENWRPVYLRGTMQALCMFFFFAGAPFLSVAQMAAGLYTYPLFVSLLAGPFLGEKIGPWRISALLIGAIGALLMLDPFTSEFSYVQLLPVVAGFFYACNLLILRRACRGENPLALTFAVAIIFITCGLLGIIILSLFPPSQDIRLAMPFVAVGWPELVLLAALIPLLCSFMNLFGNICLARAYQTADSSWLAPLDFSYLLFAAIWGRILFDSWPTSQAIFGMALIAAGGMITAWRESRTQKI
jgi:drug/metabolite transporter (DMT)-like permease|tara:strand:- start:389 stop:1354 length:966 start_codon:yes stop_codon:yes gene_type:complete